MFSLTNPYQVSGASYSNVLKCNVHPLYDDLKDISLLVSLVAGRLISLKFSIVNTKDCELIILAYSYK